MVSREVGPIGAVEEKVGSERVVWVYESCASWVVGACC